MYEVLIKQSLGKWMQDSIKSKDIYIVLQYKPETSLEEGKVQ